MAKSTKTEIQDYSAVLGRAMLASMLGQSFGGNRDIYQVLGYNKQLTYNDYLLRYDRQDIASAIIDKPVNATWRGGFWLLEGSDDEETPLEREWKKLYNGLGIKSIFKRLDKLACLGRYSVLFLGFDDVSSPQELASEVEKGAKLIYLKPLSEQWAEIVSLDDDMTSARFGLPEYYDVDLGGDGPNQTLRIHHSRVLHVTTDLLESEIYGTPVLRKVFNRLADLEKIVGASAEMFWRNGMPGYHGKVDADTMLTSEQEEKLKDQLSEYEHNLRRFLITQGFDIEALSANVADPSGPVDVQLQMISAATGIPKRILVGSERGELASTQDRENWLDYVQSRREEYAETRIVRPFITRLIEVGALPEPIDETYSIMWQDLFTPSEKDKAEVGKLKSETVKNYAAVPMATDILPLKSFYRTLLNLDDEEIKLIEQEREQQILEEEVAISESVESEE